MQQQSFCLRVVFCHEERGWAAQCLEYDIASQGRTISEAKGALEKAFVSQVAVDVSHGVLPLSLVPQAPRQYWEMFERGERLSDRKPFYVPPAYMVRAAAEDMRVCA